MDKLPNDLQLMAACMYQEYLTRKKHGCDRIVCKNLSHDFFSKSEALSYIYSDFDSIMEDLTKRNLVKCDILGNVEITNDFLVMMEERFSSDLESISKFIGALLPLIPR